MGKEMKEYQLQKAIVTYIKLQYPNVLYCASAGGLRTSMTQAVKMKASGYIKGYPDLSILEPIGNFHSLFLEVKTKKGCSGITQILTIGCLQFCLSLELNYLLFYEI